MKALFWIIVVFVAFGLLFGAPRGTTPTETVTHVTPAKADDDAIYTATVKINRAAYWGLIRQYADKLLADRGQLKSLILVKERCGIRLVEAAEDQLDILATEYPAEYNQAAKTVELMPMDMRVACRVLSANIPQNILAGNDDVYTAALKQGYKYGDEATRRWLETHFVKETGRNPTQADEPPPESRPTCRDVGGRPACGWRNY
jgi:hypothetical protein